MVNFVQFETKEMILKKVWQKKIQVGDKRIQFDHDYPPEIVERHKTYLGTKNALKEKGIHFQTAVTKIQIHWNNGVKVITPGRPHKTLKQGELRWKN